MTKEKELLRKQLELLAEQSKGAVDKELSELSAAMCNVYASLKRPTVATLLGMLAAVNAQLVVYLAVHNKKLFR